MPKNRERNEAEYFKGIIRSLKSEVRNLRKRLRELEKTEAQYIDAVNGMYEGDIEPTIEPKQETCPDCSKGSLQEVIVLNRAFKRCSVCNWRSKATKL